MSLAVQLALAQDAAIGDETPPADPASAKALTAATIAATESKVEVFKPPRGFPPFEPTR